MAKKRGTSARPKKRKKKKRPDMALQFVKVVGALGMLVILVVVAALVAHFMLKRPPSVTPPKTKVPAAQKSKQAKPTYEQAKPTYEIYPKKSPPPKPVTRQPRLSGNQRPIAAIVIDDIGYDRQVARRMLQMDAPLTFSILPHGPHSRQLAAEARKKGHELMLHLPMEPEEFPDIDPGPGALLKQMKPDDLIGQLNSHLDLFSGLKGVNNHMGSGISTSPEHMRQIFSILKKRGLFYIDSRTTPKTVARASARLLQLAFVERDIFIDHLENEKFIRGQLKKLIVRAREQGYAVGIAHPHAITQRVLADFLPQLEKKVKLVPASAVVEAEMQMQLSKAATK